MNQVRVKTRDPISVCVFKTEIISSLTWDDENCREATVWGLRVSFTDGKIVELPDLCPKQSDVEELKIKLDGAVLRSDFLSDIVDDYLGYIYGLPF
ncbi:MAG TPA: hypothetical protein DEB10_15470 [Ruminococcaceae bacterium]|nr:hypothetical protein [Oscillospiraceae bacterium]